MIIQGLQHLPAFPNSQGIPPIREYDPSVDYWVWNLVANPSDLLKKV